jgi:nucleoid-associated protein YgaU
VLDPDSRYANRPIDTLVTPDGREVRYVRSRALPDPERFRVLTEVVVADGDRLDLVCARTFGNPSLWWRIADANEALDPADLIATPGRKLKIPSPI